MADEPQDPSFLKRWSTRKREAANAPVIEDWPDKDAKVQTPFPLGDADVNPIVDAGQDQPDETDEQAVGVESVDVQSEPLLTDADMPPIESLTATSDVSAFFNKGVSAALRKAALRFVFQQPEFNVRDGLNDYDGDYTVFEPLGDTITSDMKFHAARKEKARLEAEEEARRAEEELRAQQDQVEQEPELKTDAEDESDEADMDSAPTDSQGESADPSQRNEDVDSQEPVEQLAEKEDETSSSELFTTAPKDVTQPV